MDLEGTIKNIIDDRNYKEFGLLVSVNKSIENILIKLSQDIVFDLITRKFVNLEDLITEIVFGRIHRKQLIDKLLSIPDILDVFTKYISYDTFNKFIDYVAIIKNVSNIEYRKQLARNIALLALKSNKFDIIDRIILNSFNNGILKRVSNVDITGRKIKIDPSERVYYFSYLVEIIEISDYFRKTKTFEDICNFIGVKNGNFNNVNKTIFKDVVSVIDVRMDNDIFFKMIAKNPPTNISFLYKVLLDNVQTPLIDIDSESDIQNMIKKYEILFSEQEDQNAPIPIFFIRNVYEYREMIRYGLYPINIKFDRKFVDYYDNIDTLLFSFIHKDDMSYYEDLNIRDCIWQYASLEYYKSRALTTCETFPLLNYPKLIYSSNRPKTDMHLFRSETSKSISKNDLVPNEDGYTFTIKIDDEKWNAIPVTRYAKSVDLGLYYVDKKSKFCGTFYYYEPESNTYLAYHTNRQYFNKYVAFNNLSEGQNYYIGTGDPVEPGAKLGDGETTFEIFSEDDSNYSSFDNPSKFKIIEDFVSGKLPPDLILTPRDYIMYFNDDYKQELLDEFKEILDMPYYAGDILYALEDWYDQSICKISHQKNIDLLFLEHMAGNFGMVFEVLDSRSRYDSISSLLYLVEE